MRDLDNTHKSVALCFVIGPIGSSGTDVRKHADLLLNSVIKHVLEAPEFGYQVKRADEDADPGMIGDRVVADILHAALVVADLTDLNPNALYELGIRHASQKPTIHIARLGTTLPFDNVSHRTIFVDLGDWHNSQTARSHLAAAARKIKAPDFQVTNPVTQAYTAFKMRESADPRDKVILNLQERLNGIESKLTFKRFGGENKSVSNGSKSIVDLTPNWRKEANSEYLYIDTQPFLGIRGDVVSIAFDSIENFGHLLDSIYFYIREIDRDFPAYTYEKNWVLFDEKGNKISKTSDEDRRSLKQIGVGPWNVLRVMPL